MRDDAASADSSAVDLGSNFALPGADAVARAWSERSPESYVTPQHPEKAMAVSAEMLVLGAGLVWFVPLGGALLLVSGCLGLATLWDAPGGSGIRNGEPSNR